VGFYAIVGIIPFSMFIYQLSHVGPNDSQPALTRMIAEWSDMKEKWTARNTLHTAMAEQAAFDRTLFYSERGSSTIDLKFPE
jgi:hypothetical protein